MIKPITYQVAKLFFSLNREKQVTFSETGDYFGYFQHDSLLGIISTNKSKNTFRIKTFLVNKNSRNMGIGTKLLNFVVVDRGIYTAFATKYSQNIFIAKGFTVVSEKRNDIKFLKYDKSSL